MIPRGAEAAALLRIRRVLDSEIENQLSPPRSSVSFISYRSAAQPLGRCSGYGATACTGPPRIPCPGKETTVNPENQVSRRRLVQGIGVVGFGGAGCGDGPG